MKKILATIIAVVVALAVGFAGGMYYAKTHTDENFDPVAFEEKLLRFQS